ncbi:nuclear transport factor 2 family protein [Sphingobium tyrosinilyticum]|uniref:Nuclear transport factor 2 family protein n=1 Tax=Sphingobium tyrosinilyticum TaxID=2715436 RepID=A0ABV9F672_9SPHN
MDEAIDARLRRLEDQLAIYQLVCGYGYAVDGLNGEAVADCYAQDGVYTVADSGRFEGREAVASITRDPTHIGYVTSGCAHMSTLPHVVIQGGRAVATCHTMVARHGPDGFSVFRLSASGIELARQADGAWRIVHRQNRLLDGDPAGPALLGRFKEALEVR